MRLGYLIPRIILVTIVWAFFAFAFDPLVRVGLISTSESTVGAQVDVAGLSSGFFPPVVSIDSVNVANKYRPGKELVEFDNMTVRLHGDALLKKQLVVESGEITGIRIGDLREDDGQLEPSSGESVLDGYSDRFKQMGAAWLDELQEEAKLALDPKQLETYQVGEQLHDKWHQRLDALRNQVAVLEPQLKNVENLVRSARSGKTVDQIQKYSLAATQSQTIMQSAQQLTAVFQKLPAEVRSDLTRLNQARLHDQQQLKAKAELLRPDPVLISELLFGPELTGKLKNALSYFETAKKYKAALTNDAQAVRTRGQDVLFPLREVHPDFLMKQLRLSGVFSLDGQELPFQATLGGMTSDPALLGKPVEFLLTAGPDQAIKLRAQFDRTTVRAVDRLLLTSRSFQPTKNLFGDQESLAVNVLAALSEWDCQFQLVDNEVVGSIHLVQSDVSMQAVGDRVQHPILQRIINDALSAVGQLDCRLNVTGSPLKPQLAVQSDLGPRLANGLKTALFNEVNVQAQELAVRSKLADEYKSLMGEHADLMEHIQLVKSIVPADPTKLRSMNVNDVIRTASQSKVVREQFDKHVGNKLQEKIGKELGGLPTIPGLQIPGLKPQQPKKENSQRNTPPNKIQREINRLQKFGGLGGLLPPGALREIVPAGGAKK